MVQKVAENLPVTEKHALTTEAVAAPVDKVQAAPAPGEYRVLILHGMGRRRTGFRRGYVVRVPGPVSHERKAFFIVKACSRVVWCALGGSPEAAMVKELIGKLTADKTAASGLGDLIKQKSVTFCQVLHFP